jgi:hypothetical protein
MKNIVLIGMCFLSLLSSYGQNRNSIWCFGDSAGIDFRNPGNPVTFKSGIRSRSDCASVSDKNGNLLFYVGSDTANSNHGGFVYNRNHDQMPFGWGLVTGSWNHEMIIIPMPGDSDKYYIFHTAITTQLGIYYTIVDMSLDNGYGDVTYYNVNINTESVTDGVAAVKHANGRDWWLIYANAYDGSPTNEFIEYLITPNGISAPTLINIGTTHITNSGDLNFSNDGEKFIFTTITNLIEVFDFDRCTGTFSNPVIVMPENPGPGYNVIASGVLSPDKNLIYISSCSDTSYLFQYDLRVNPVNSSKDTIAVFPDIIFSAAMLRLAPDSKIYLSSIYQNNVHYFFPYSNTEYNYYNMNLGVINSPDSVGAACNFQPYSFYLGGSRTYLGLPNNPNYELGAIHGSICDSLISVEELDEKNGYLNIYPNPFSEGVWIEPLKQRSEMALIEIENDTGQKIFSKEILLKRQQLDLSFVPEGIYFMHVSTGSFSVVKRLIRI